MRQFSPAQFAKAIAPHRIENVANYVGVTERTIRNWLAGKGEPRATHLHYIVAFTGKNWAYFFQKAA